MVAKKNKLFFKIVHRDVLRTKFEEREKWKILASRKYLNYLN